MTDQGLPSTVPEPMKAVAGAGPCRPGLSQLAKLYSPSPSNGTALEISPRGEYAVTARMAWSGTANAIQRMPCSVTGRSVSTSPLVSATVA